MSAVHMLAQHDLCTVLCTKFSLYLVLVMYCFYLKKCSIFDQQLASEYILDFDNEDEMLNATPKFQVMRHDYL